MNLFGEILGHSSGAEFRRADLHIHSHGTGGSYDVADITMTPENIIDTALKENLHIVSITDHQSTANAKIALKYAEGKDIYLIPGVEITTPQGHLLIYCPTFEKLDSFLGKLNISEDRKYCSQSIPDCLKLVGQYEGFGIIAHVDRKKGSFETIVSGYPPIKEEIFIHPELLALEVMDSKNEAIFTNREANVNRKELAKKRWQALGEEENHEIAKVMSSDAHSLDMLGLNAKGKKKLTRIKLENPSFGALKIALVDSAARVRIEDLIPNSIPHFVGLKLEGGFLKGQVINFSKNLTCIIGGRGAGKSTTLESLIAASGNPYKDQLVDSEVGADRISLVYEDETGRRQILTKDKLTDVVNVSNPDAMTWIPIESYGQGKTAETIQHCGKDPGILLEFLDGFCEFQELKKQDETIRKDLLDNQTSIEHFRLEVASIPGIERAKNNADEQVKVLKQQNVKQIVELEEALVRESGFRENLSERLSEFIQAVKTSLSDDSDLKSILGLDGEKLISGKKEFAEVKKIISQFLGDIKKTSTSLGSTSVSIEKNIEAQFSAWENNETKTRNTIETLRKRLAAKGIKLDMGFIRKVTKDAHDYDLKLKELNQQKEKLAVALRTRQKLLASRKDLKKKIYGIRFLFARELNSRFVESISDYTVSIKYYEGLHSPAFSDVIKSALGWRTSQVPRADLMAMQLSPFQLLDAIHKKDIQVIEGIKDLNGNSVFAKQEAKDVLIELGKEENIFNIERCEFEDRPQIMVAKQVDLPTGLKQMQVRDFSKLSLGQQQSILLTILLYSKSNCPLLIDQPEDNLDSEFIYKTLVGSLRRIKEKRQVIIVTHNANIAVLGDAELIIPLKSTSDRSLITNRGSIDTPATKVITCDILEGGEKAFTKRRKMYNIP